MSMKIYLLAILIDRLLLKLRLSSKDTTTIAQGP